MFSCLYLLQYTCFTIDLSGHCSMFLCRYKKLLILWLIAFICIITGLFFIFFSSSCRLFDCFSGESGKPKPSFEEELLSKEGQMTCSYVKLSKQLSYAKIVNGSPQLGSDRTYFVVYNYFKAFQIYGINSSVTYATHASTEFIKHVPDLAVKWDGPISVAVFVPSYDFCSAVLQIVKMRACGHPSVRSKVSWHFFWPKGLWPPINWRLQPVDSFENCDIDLYLPSKSSRQNEGNGYPVNVGRNIAREAATTWFVLPSDVELHPSKNLSSQFIAFIKEVDSRKQSKLAQFWPRVYVTPVFEVINAVPDTKEELLHQINKGEAVYFHRYVCPHCQRIPGLITWLQTFGKKGQINAFSAVKRHFPYHRWEPIYICTKNEPFYDERLSWEGLQDKMSQMHELCLKNYSFVILDRGFVVHSPGIKQQTKKTSNLEAYRKPFIDNNTKIYNIIMQELSEKHGPNTKCRTH